MCEGNSGFLTAGPKNPGEHSEHDCLTSRTGGHHCPRKSRDGQDVGLEEVTLFPQRDNLHRPIMLCLLGFCYFFPEWWFPHLKLSPIFKRIYESEFSFSWPRTMRESEAPVSPGDSLLSLLKFPFEKLILPVILPMTFCPCTQDCDHLIQSAQLFRDHLQATSPVTRFSCCSGILFTTDTALWWDFSHYWKAFNWTLSNYLTTFVSRCLSSYPINTTQIYEPVWASQIT